MRSLHGIQRDLLKDSAHLRGTDFNAIHPNDLELLFRLYDRTFFDGYCTRALDSRPLTFRLSPRMTRAGGKTARFVNRHGQLSYEISIAISMLFDGFTERDRLVTVCGVECPHRLEALQRIFEHEIVHLVELLCWGQSDCKGERFQDIAHRFFRHRAHTHNLVTRHERALDSGIRIGSRVNFAFEGRPLAGRVNRITKRATVLVEDPEGDKYADGRHYPRLLRANQSSDRQRRESDARWPKNAHSIGLLAESAPIKLRRQSKAEPRPPGSVRHPRRTRRSVESHGQSRGPKGGVAIRPGTRRSRSLCWGSGLHTYLRSAAASSPCRGSSPQPYAPCGCNRESRSPDTHCLPHKDRESRPNALPIPPPAAYARPCIAPSHSASARCA